MKFLLLITLAASVQLNLNMPLMNELKPCPNSPNCVCTQETKKSKTMEPLSFSGSSAEAMEKLKKIISNCENTTLKKESENYLHYEFVTKLGKFTDDVEFLIDSENRVIHFRSASRKGYGDFGKNKRRMKGIQKMWAS